MNVFIVYAAVDDTRLALHAFANRDLAERFIERATRREYDDAGLPLMTPIELLDISALYVEELPVRGAAS